MGLRVLNLSAIKMIAMAIAHEKSPLLCIQQRTGLNRLVSTKPLQSSMAHLAKTKQQPAQAFEPG